VSIAVENFGARIGTREEFISKWRVRREPIGEISRTHHDLVAPPRTAAKGAVKKPEIFIAKRTEALTMRGFKRSSA